MLKPSLRFFAVPKKTFLIKLVSVLGFGGMVGFCVLGCEKPHKGGRDVVETFEEEREMTTVYAPPLEIEPLDGQPDALESEDAALSPEVLAPKQPMPEQEAERDIAVKYGVPPILDRDVVAMYGAPMPKD